MAAPGALQSQLVAARALAERATGVEPNNANHWRLLADLCERTGQQGRAEAIRLQGLTGRGDAALAGSARAASRWPAALQVRQAAGRELAGCLGKGADRSRCRRSATR
ncbi:MAG: hypothetical protein ACK51Z_05285 [Pseudomonadota bacterium]|jgi:hypothetical protein